MSVNEWRFWGWVICAIFGMISAIVGLRFFAFSLWYAGVTFLMVTVAVALWTDYRLRRRQ